MPSCQGHQTKRTRKIAKTVLLSRIISSHQEQKKPHRILLKVKTPTTLRTISNLTLSMTPIMLKNRPRTKTRPVFKMKVVQTLGTAAGQMKSMINLWRL